MSDVYFFVNNDMNVSCSLSLTGSSEVSVFVLTYTVNLPGRFIKKIEIQSSHSYLKGFKILYTILEFNAYLQPGDFSCA